MSARAELLDPSTARQTAVFFCPNKQSELMNSSDSLPDMDHGLPDERTAPETPEFHPPTLEESTEVFEEDMKHPDTVSHDAKLER